MTDGGFDTAKHERLRDPDRLKMLKIPQVVKRLVHRDTMHAIDVGAGTGVWSEAFLNAGVGQVTAVDSSSKMIDQIRKLVPQAKVMQTTADTIRMPTETADLVFAAFVLHEVPDKVAALKEWKRLCRKTVAVMEWPYHEDEDVEEGPPPSRRMSQEEVTELGRQASLGEPDVWKTKDWLLYTWNITHVQQRSTRHTW
jgi:ubiquinone/menaquinone biosynthesis C-methylase UbiE